MDTNTLEDTFGTFEHMEQVPQPSESKEPEMTTKNRKYNLRKSLAWDSAFFTSAGMLSALLENMKAFCLKFICEERDFVGIYDRCSGTGGVV